jgi:hypothetical protein
MDALVRGVQRSLKEITQPGDQVVGILSGDLSLLGGDSDINFARTWWLNQVVSGREQRWVLGNHDFWAEGLRRTAWGHEKLHEGVRARHPHPVDTFIPMPWTPTTNVRLYLMDSTPTEFFENLPAKGRIYGADFRRVSESIQSERASDSADGIATISVVIMHHPRDVLRNKDDYTADIEDYADLVLVGHTHKFGFVPDESTSPSSTLKRRHLDHHPPFVHRKAVAPGFLVHDLTEDGKGQVTITTTPWAFSRGEFRPSTTGPANEPFPVPIVP